MFQTTYIRSYIEVITLCYLIIQAISLGVLIASVITIKSVIDIFDDDIPDDSDAGQDRDRYQAVAGCLLFVSIAGIITQVIFAIVRGLFYRDVIKSHFIAFGVVVSLIHSLV